MAETMTPEELRTETEAMSACEDCTVIGALLADLAALSKRGILTSVEYLRASGEVSDAQIRHEDAAHPRWRAEIRAVIAKAGASV